MTGPADSFEAAVANAMTKAVPLVIDALTEATGPRAYSVDEVAGRLSVSASTVRRLIDDGKLAAVPNLSPPRVAADELAAFLRGAA